MKKKIPRCIEAIEEIEPINMFGKTVPCGLCSAIGEYNDDPCHYCGSYKKDREKELADLCEFFSFSSFWTDEQMEEMNLLTSEEGIL